MSGNRITIRLGVAGVLIVLVSLLAGDIEQRLARLRLELRRLVAEAVGRGKTSRNHPASPISRSSSHSLPEPPPGISSRLT